MTQALTFEIQFGDETDRTELTERIETVLGSVPGITSQDSRAGAMDARHEETNPLAAVARQVVRELLAQATPEHAAVPVVTDDNIDAVVSLVIVRGFQLVEAASKGLAQFVEDAAAVSEGRYELRESDHA